MVRIRSASSKGSSGSSSREAEVLSEPARDKTASQGSGNSCLLRQSNQVLGQGLGQVLGQGLARGRGRSGACVSYHQPTLLHVGPITVKISTLSL